MYSDDCVLYFSGNTWEHVHSESEQSLAHISTWLTQNALKLNVKKSKCLTIAKRSKRKMIDQSLSLTVSGQSLEFVDNY